MPSTTRFSIISPSLMSMAVRARSAVMRALSSREDMESMSPRTKSPLRTLV